MTNHGLLIPYGSLRSSLASRSCSVGVAEAQTYGFASPRNCRTVAADTSKGHCADLRRRGREQGAEAQRSTRAPRNPVMHWSMALTATMEPRRQGDDDQGAGNRCATDHVGHKGSRHPVQAPKPGKLVPITDTTQYPYTAVGLFSNGCPAY